MRRFWFILFVIVCLISGCEGKQKAVDRALNFRQTLLKSEGSRFLAHITADLGDMTYSFSLDCTMDKEGNISFSVVAPSSISGVTGGINGQSGRLSFDDKILAIPMIAQDQISPVSAPYLLCRGLRGGYIRSCGQEEQGYRISLEDSFQGESIRADVWLDEADRPVFGEIIWQDRRILSVRFEDYRFL